MFFRQRALLSRWSGHQDRLEKHTQKITLAHKHLFCHLRQTQAQSIVSWQLSALHAFYFFCPDHATLLDTQKICMIYSIYCWTDIIFKRRESSNLCNHFSTWTAVVLWAFTIYQENIIAVRTTFSPIYNLNISVPTDTPPHWQVSLKSFLSCLHD